MKRGRGIGLGIFLIILGVGLFADRMGWFPFNAVWLLPALLVAWGVAVLYRAIKDK